MIQSLESILTPKNEMQEHLLLDRIFNADLGKTMISLVPTDRDAMTLVKKGIFAFPKISKINDAGN